MANLVEWVASTTKSRSTVNGSDTTPLVNSGTKVGSSTVRRKEAWRTYDEAGKLLKEQTFK